MCGYTSVPKTDVLDFEYIFITFFHYRRPHVFVDDIGHTRHGAYELMRRCVCVVDD